MTQCDKILLAMLENKNIEEWTAKDFQSEKYFVGYEASARMSDLMRRYPGLFVVGRQEKFRTLKINWEYEDMDLIKNLFE